MEKVYSNGLRLVSLPKKDKKVCCVVLYIAGGTQSEKNYQSGISEYLTKILLMGTRKHPTAEGLFNYAKENGIVLTAHNSKESISISALCLNKNVKAAIELLSEIAFETNFSVENGEKARKTQLSQVAMLAENPLFVMDKLLNSTLYYRTGLANPKHGSNISVSRFRTLDAKDFLEKIFTPRNTIISVVGNIDEAYESVTATKMAATIVKSSAKPGVVAGDKIVLVFNAPVYQNPATITVNSMTANVVADTANTVYEITLAGTESISDSTELTYGSITNVPLDGTFGTAKGVFYFCCSHCMHLLQVH